MKSVISASRRTDLVAFFPEWLSSVFRTERARVAGPSGGAYDVDLRPSRVHTVVLWSKDFTNLISNRGGLKDLLGRYDQIYLHFTITGLGGGFIEREAPAPGKALDELPRLVDIAGSPRRLSLRFDPVVFWKEKDSVESNLHFFETLCGRAESLGIEDIRFSFAQWYRKARLRAARSGFPFVDPGDEEKLAHAAALAGVARGRRLRLYSCGRKFLAAVPGILESACIDGRRLGELHPRGEPADARKDRTQRAECRCTRSLDIGSYAQTCPHACLYCYANPRIEPSANDGP